MKGGEGERVTYLRRAGGGVVSTGHEHHHSLLVDLLLGFLMAIFLLEFEARGGAR